jgi:hypothetical protein
MIIIETIKTTDLARKKAREEPELINHFIDHESNFFKDEYHKNTLRAIFCSDECNNGNPSSTSQNENSTTDTTPDRQAKSNSGIKNFLDWLGETFCDPLNKLKNSVNNIERMSKEDKILLLGELLPDGRSLGEVMMIYRNSDQFLQDAYNVFTQMWNKYSVVYGANWVLKHLCLYIYANYYLIEYLTANKIRRGITDTKTLIFEEIEKGFFKLSDEELRINNEDEFAQMVIGNALSNIVYQEESSERNLVYIDNLTRLQEKHLGENDLFPEYDNFIMF